MGTAIMKVNKELLVRALHLPENTKIMCVEDAYSPFVVSLLIEHPDITTKEVNPAFRRTEYMSTYDVEFISWNA